MLRADFRDLNRVIAELRSPPDTAPLMREIADRAVRQTQERFDRREAPDGTPWPPRRDSLGHPLLERTGRMRRSIAARDLRDDEATIGTSGVPYAGVHQHGGGNVPRREFIGIGDEDADDLVSEAWLVNDIGERLR